MNNIKIAILASGSGSNAEQITRHFEKHDKITVSLILSNKKDAFVLERAKKLGVQNDIFTRTQFYESDEVYRSLKANAIDYIILAGFLWLIPSKLIAAYDQKIINIHPSLLPKFGGKGMYGSKVHEAVIANKETESGITIHLVDEIYDNGEVLCQQKVSISLKDTPDTLASKIHELEHKHFPETIENFILNK